MGVDRAAETAQRVAVAVGEAIRRARHRGGLSQQELGAAAGIDQAQISKFERGVEGNVYVWQVVAIAEALDMAPATLFLAAFPDPTATVEGTIMGDDALDDFHRKAVLTMYRGALTQTGR